jgi:hypothetical protein
MPLNIIWEEKNYNEIVDQFSFEINFPDSKSALYFAEFNHELKFDGCPDALKQLFFTDAQMMGSKLILWLPKMVQVKVTEDLSMKITEPGIKNHK